MSRLAPSAPPYLLRMLVQVRLSAGLNQTALGERLGITQSEVSKFERGERALGGLRLRAWMRALGLDFPPLVHNVEHALGEELERVEA